MVALLTSTLATSEDATLRAMFAARKSVFVDLLKWNLPIADGKFEIDEFDDQHARYLILLSDAGNHLASARLLPTSRPHILSTLFPELCEGAVPSDAASFEITRFCIDRSLRAEQRRKMLHQLVTAIVEHALSDGIRRYTAVTDMAFLQQVLSFGWECRPLGLPVANKTRMLGALEIGIDAATPAHLARTGMWSPVPAIGSLSRRVAA